VALIVGAEVLVRAGSSLASWLGIRPMVIGLPVVSLGTSVPERAVGIDAARSGSPGLAVGNIVGTNLVNILLILGLSAVLVPIALDGATLRFELPAMTAAAFLLYVLAIDGRLTRLDAAVPVFVSGKRISRTEGGLFVVSYLGYLTWLLRTRTCRPTRLARHLGDVGSGPGAIEPPLHAARAEVVLVGHELGRRTFE
jgi:cation:H+ antiporter